MHDKVYRRKKIKYKGSFVGGGGEGVGGGGGGGRTACHGVPQKEAKLEIFKLLFSRTGAKVWKQIHLT